MNQALFFLIGAERFGVLLEAVSGVVRGAWPLRVPRQPFGCIGALEVRGELLPLLDAGALLGMRRTLRPEAWSEKLIDSHVLLVDSGGMALALWVDRVLEITDDLAMESTLAQPGDAASSKRSLLIDPSALVGERRRKLLMRAVAGVRGAEGRA